MARGQKGAGKLLMPVPPPSQAENVAGNNIEGGCLTRSPGTQRWGGDCLPPGQHAQLSLQAGASGRFLHQGDRMGAQAPAPRLLSVAPAALSSWAPSSAPLPGLFLLLLCSPLPPASHLSTLPACLQPAPHPHPEPPNPQHLSCSPDTGEPSPRLGVAMGRWAWPRGQAAPPPLHLLSLRGASGLGAGCR